MKRLLCILLLINVLFMFGCKKDNIVDISLEEKYYYDKSNDSPMLVKCENINEIKEIIMNDKSIYGYSFTDTNIVIPKKEFKSYGIYNVKCNINNKEYFFEIQVIDSRVPILKGSNIIQYNNNDIIIEFDLFGGKIESIEYKDVKENDYLIADNKVKIYARAIELFSEQNTDITYTLSYIDSITFEHKELTGVITITKIIFGPIIW